MASKKYGKLVNKTKKKHTHKKEGRKEGAAWVETEGTRNHQRGKESWGQLSIWGLTGHSTAVSPQKAAEWPPVAEEEVAEPRIGKHRVVCREETLPQKNIPGGGLERWRGF